MRSLRTTLKSEALITHCTVKQNNGTYRYLNMLDYEKREVKWAAKEHQKGVYACDYCRLVLRGYTVNAPLKLS